MDKSLCNEYVLIQTSSLEISSLLKVNPGISPLFLSQNIDAKLPEKNMPSTAAKATIRSPKVAVLLAIHCIAQSAFFFTQGNVSIALNKKSLHQRELIYSFYFIFLREIQFFRLAQNSHISNKIKYGFTYVIFIFCFTITQMTCEGHDQYFVKEILQMIVIK